MRTILTEISEALQKGRSKLIKELVPQALEQGLAAQVILEDGLLAGMDVIGQKFKNNEVFVPEVLVAARAMNTGAELLKSALAASGSKSKGTVILGTVKGDMHDIGKNLVRMMFEGKGLEVIDLGVDVEPEAFIEAAKTHNSKVIACSALLTTTMPMMSQVIEAANKAGIRNQVKIMIGGAPVSQQFCQSIGADAYTPDATSAAECAVALLA